MITAEKLIRYGYFPHWIIPPFKSESLADVLPILSNEKMKSNFLRRENKKEVGKFRPFSKCCVHSVPKIKNFRRSIHIPNPLYQIILSDTIETNWAEIEKILKKSKLSLSFRNLKYKKSKKLPPVFDRHEMAIQNALRSTDSRFVVNTDISRFYPTIYTHTIPWAVHTKAVAKINHSSSLFGNDLDICVRSCQDQQTLGIPTGPYTSHIIANIIASEIDDKLYQELKKKKIRFKGYRYVDDYKLFFKTHADSEFAVSKLNLLFRFYELEINSSKTKITELPEILESGWVSDLKNFKFKQISKSDKKTPIANNYEILSLFSKAFEYVETYPNQNVLKYALKMMKNVEVKYKDWGVLESLILKSVIAEPTCLPWAIKLFFDIKTNAGKKKFRLNIPKIRDTIYEMVRFHSQYDHGYEIAWSLWLAKALEIKLPKKISKLLSENDDSIVALVSLDLEKSGLLSSPLDYKKWIPLMTQDELYTENWLFAYEVVKKKWIPLGTKPNYVDKDPFFSILKNNDVDFYDEAVGMIDRIRDIDFGDFEIEGYEFAFLDF
jgi:hypothetical protein